MPTLGLFGGAAPRLPQRIRELPVQARSMPSVEEIEALRQQEMVPSVRRRPPGMMMNRIAPAAATAAPVIVEPAQTSTPPLGMMMKGPPKPKTDKGVDWFGLAGLAGATLNEMGGNIGSVANFTDRRTKRADQDALNEAFANMNLTPEEAIYARSDPNGFLAARFEQANTLKKPQTETFWDPAINGWRKKPLGPVAVADGVDLVDPETRQAIYTNEKSPGDDIRQVGNQIVQRQQDGSWRAVYTGSTPAETARAFQGFIDQATGEQMIVMSNGAVQGTGRAAYVPPQITSVGGVPTAVDKRTLTTTELSPIETAAGNKAAMASAEVQGKAQGQAAFDLPTIEMRSQSAIRSIGDLRTRDIGTRFGLQSKLYAIPGTDGADVQALVNQVTSQAFLNAFDQLRGAGAITEREGQAATQAITRLQNQNISVGEAMQAMDELDRYYRKGLEVARQKATKGPVLPQAATAGQPQAPAGRTATMPAMQLGIRAYASQSNIPADAITEFLSNPSTPQEIAEFNEEFGDGQAEAILKAMQRGR